MKKKFGAFGARQFSLETLVGGRPGTTIFQNPGGGGGGWGGRIQGLGPAAPPWTNDSCQQWATLDARVVPNMGACSIHLCLNDRINQR